MKPKPKLNPVSLLRYALQGVVLAVLASVAVFFYTLKPQTYTALLEFQWGILVLLFPMIATAWLCNGLRVFILSRSLGYPLTLLQSLSISLSFEFGVAATPAGVGGTVIRLALLKRSGIPLAHGTSMLAIDVAIDTVFFLLLVPFAIWAVLSNQDLLPTLSMGNIYELILVAVLVVGGIVGGIAMVRSGLFLRLIREMANWPAAQHRRLPARLRWYEWRFEREFIKMKQGLHHFWKIQPWVLVLNFMLASTQWICRYGILPMLLIALAAPINPFLLFLMQGLLFTLSLMVVLPGGGGTVEGLTTVILNGLVQDHLVGVVVLLWRFFTYHMYLLIGGIVFFYTINNLKTIFPATANLSDELDFSESDLDEGVQTQDDRPSPPDSSS